MRVHQPGGSLTRVRGAEVDWSWRLTRRRLGVLWRLTRPYKVRTFFSGFSLLAATAIARALAVDPRILILDDATASVDATTEARIRAGLREVMSGRTTLIIAHRLSTIALADEIVVLDGGRVCARGTDEELLETSSVYREIHDHGLLERQFADAVEARADVEEVA